MNEEHGPGPEGEVTIAPKGELVERRRWCEKLAEKIVGVMQADDKPGAPRRTSDAEATSVAMLLWDVGERHGQKSGRFGDHPSELVFAHLLEQQGVSPVAALVTAQTMLSIDASRLVVSTAEAEKLVGVTRTTLARNVQSGNLRPAIALQKTGRERLHSYWLSDILWVLGWRRVNPITPGRGSQWYPEPVPARASLS